MDLGTNISASGVLTAMYRQDVLSNNLANASTVGFKAMIPATRQRAAASVEDGVMQVPSNTLLERLKGGVLLAPNLVDMGQGAISPRGGPLDVAIEGRGFLAVRKPGGNDGGEDAALALTRDGRMTRNPAGRLVTTDGFEVLDTGGSPITIAPGGEVTIDGNGRISQNGAVVATLKFVDVADPGALRPLGNGMLDVKAGTEFAEASGRLIQGSVEESGVDEIRTIMQITSASREVEANISMMRQIDRLNGELFNTFARLT